MEFIKTKRKKQVEMKTTKPNNIDEYIAAFPKDIREILEQVHATIKEAAPGAEETIKYEMPTFMLKGNLVHFKVTLFTLQHSKIISVFTRCLQEIKHLKKNFLFTKQGKGRFNFQ